MTNSNDIRQDVYTRITSQIVANLERGVRPWIRPWNAEDGAGLVTRPLRYNGESPRRLEAFNVAGDS